LELSRELRCVLDKLLEVDDLQIVFPVKDGWFKAVDGVSFQIAPGGITCLVGQSGSGKSLTGMALSGTLPLNARLTQGRIRFEGVDLLPYNQQQLASIRGKKIFSIFQNPMNSFNASLTIGRQLANLAASHGLTAPEKSSARLFDILDGLGFREPERILRQYPFQLSGGMLQRVMIAGAMMLQPVLLVADEPTTALDVTVQKQILQQFRMICSQWQTALLLITHDFGVVAELADDVMVMKEGKIVETGDVFQIFDHPRDAYTKALIEATFSREKYASC
jgi:ABC-type dipeptide/oligopeptide/nickel transport system ATPase component